jgi:prepilin-type N-terminal cleavage/methylation domain-containing protein
MITQKRQAGFTIVELLIVVVVIAILAAITIVAYNGITKKALISKLNSDLSTAAKTLENDKTVSTSGDYPATLSAANGGRGIIASNGGTYQYTVNNTANPKAYCITETINAISYNIDQSGTIKEGYCPGQSAPSVVTTLAGSSWGGFTDCTVTGTSALLNTPYGVTAASTGVMYIVDSGNHCIRKVSSSGSISMFSANGGISGYDNGTAAAARFNSPKSIAASPGGVLYVADSFNNQIRKVASNGDVTLFAGSATAASGFADGNGAVARFSNPTGITVDSSGNVYVADSSNNRIRKITTNGDVTTIAGASTSGTADGNGSLARFSSPYGIVVDTSGILFVTDYGSHRIRKITTNGDVTTIAGSSSGFADGNGTNAKFANPYGITVDSSGNLYVGDYNNHRIRKVSPSGDVSTFAGTGTQGSLDGGNTSAQFSNPAGVTIDSSGVVYVADSGNHRIRKIQPQ